jgi:pSer/pThr/pTyr-binding forkhead associated (FHA) protein
MTAARSGGRAFFERQQRRRRQMQARLTGVKPGGHVPESAPGASMPGDAGQAAGSAAPEPEDRAEPSATPEPESWAEPSAVPEPEDWAEPSGAPEREDWAEQLARAERETVAERRGRPEPALRLVVTDGPNLGQTFRLRRGEVTIGREEGSDIKLDDLTVSHNHALVRRRGEVTTIEDLRSTNGTMVNGATISRPVRIAPGDLIAVGAVELMVEQYEPGQRQR